MHTSYVPVFVVVMVLVTLTVALSGCATFKKSLDTGGLSDIAKQVLAEEPSGGPKGSGPDALAEFLAGQSPERVRGSYTLVSREPFDRWKPAVHGGQVSGELLRFKLDSGFAAASVKTDSYFYFFRPPHWSGEKAILWAPGFGVSDLAFVLIRRLFEMELARGWAVLVWVPPFHLERQTKGKKAGDGLVTLDPRDLIGAVEASSDELANGFAWLQSQGVARIGGWGGSFGAASLMLVDERYRLDHLALMIPLVDWTTLWAHPSLSPLREALHAAGYTDGMVDAAFRTISPVWHTLQTEPGRVQILYARYDQLTPERVTQDYAAKLAQAAPGAGDGPDVRGYAESHATILLRPAMYRAYGEFLDRIDH